MIIFFVGFYFEFNVSFFLIQDKDLNKVGFLFICSNHVFYVHSNQWAIIIICYEYTFILCTLFKKNMIGTISYILSLKIMVNVNILFLIIVFEINLSPVHLW